MILNSYVHKNDFKETFKKYIEYFNKIGYGDLNNDALWKWSSILYSLDTLNINSTNTCVDIGGGKSPLTKIVSYICPIINVDKYPNGNWFPLNEDGNYIKSDSMKSKKNNITYIDLDFFDWCKTIEDNSIDFMYDGCSIIHFDVKTQYSKNDGCAQAIKEISRILKPGGCFIATSDILHPMYKSTISLENNKGEFLFFENLINIYNHGIMHICGDIDLSFEEDFNTNILEVNPLLTNYNKLNHQYYEGKEDWQTFCNYEGSCASNLTRCRCVFKKEV